MSSRKEARRSPSGGARRPLLHPSPTMPKYATGGSGYKNVNSESDIEFQPTTSMRNTENDADLSPVSTPNALSQTSAPDSLEPPRATPETLSADECTGNGDQRQHQKLPPHRFRKKTDSLNNGSVQQSKPVTAAQKDFGAKLSNLPSRDLQRRIAKSDDAIKEAGNRQRSNLSFSNAAAAARRLGGSVPLTVQYDLGSTTDDGFITSDKDDEDEEPLSPPWTDVIRVNVSGQRFDFRRSVLERHPTTLLGNPSKRQQYYDERRGEYFFDRHRPSFEAIFAYYQYGGRLRRPHQVADDVFLSEALFHELEPDVIVAYKRSEGYSEEEVLPTSHGKLYGVWKLFEHPETSRAAFAIALVSVSATLVAIVLLCVETLPRFAKSDCLDDNKTPNWLNPFFVIETICHAWFTLELIIRFVSCPSWMMLFRDFKTWIDVTAIIPYYATLVNVLTTGLCSAAADFRSSTSLAFLRVVRLVRIFKLTKHSLGLQVLILTFKASIEGLSMFLVALTVSMLVYSSALYYAEVSQPESQIESIPDAFWWAIITMTTVGYGDKVPVGWLGRIIGAACAISGILTLAIPVPIIAGHFNRFYSHKTGRARLQLAPDQR